MGKEAAKKIEELMRERGVKQKDIADHLNVSPAYVSSILRGSKPVTASTASKFTQALGLQPADAVALHRAAAKDMGFSLDLPDDFDE